MNVMHIFQAHTSYGTWTLHYKTARMWNKLPATFKCLKSVNLLRKEIRLYLHRSNIWLCFNVELLLYANKYY